MTLLRFDESHDGWGVLLGKRLFSLLYTVCVVPGVEQILHALDLRHKLLDAFVERHTFLVVGVELEALSDRGQTFLGLTVLVEKLSQLQIALRVIRHRSDSRTKVRDSRIEISDGFVALCSQFSAENTN